MKVLGIDTSSKEVENYDEEIVKEGKELIEIL